MRCNAGRRLVSRLDHWLVSSRELLPYRPLQTVLGNKAVVRGSGDVESVRHRHASRDQPGQGLALATKLGKAEAFVCKVSDVTWVHSLLSRAEANPLLARRRPQHRVADFGSSSPVGEGRQSFGNLAVARVGIHRSVRVG